MVTSFHIPCYLLLFDVETVCSNQHIVYTQTKHEVYANSFKSELKYYNRNKYIPFSHYSRSRNIRYTGILHPCS